MGTKVGFNDDSLFDVADVEFDNLSVSPSNPTANHIKLFFKNGTLTKLDENGIEKCIDVSKICGFTFDVPTFIEKKKVKNKYLKCYGGPRSDESTFVALKDGQIFAVSLSTSDKPESDFSIRIFKNTTKDSSGTQIGTDLVKPVNTLDHIFENLTNFTFNKGDRLSVYIVKGTQGDKQAHDPVVRLFIKYD